jgi:hypothetical protein
MVSMNSTPDEIDGTDSLSGSPEPVATAGDTSGDTSGQESHASRGPEHVAPSPLQQSPDDRDRERERERERRALHRVTRKQRFPSWLTRISWLPDSLVRIFGVDDPNFDEHHEQWEEQQRKNHEWGEP